MISRRTTLLIADIICNSFTHQVRNTDGYGRTRGYTNRVKEEELRNFLFEFNIDGYTINHLCESYYSEETLKKNILNMHTGYFYNKVNYNKFVSLGQKDIKGMAIGILYRRLQPESLVRKSFEN